MASLCEREFNATSILHILFNSVLFSVELFNSVTLWSSGNPKCKMYVNVCNCEWENRSEKRAFNERKIPETENTTCAFFLLLVQHSYTFSILANIFAEICFNSSEKRNGLQCRWKCIRMLIMIKMSNAMKKYKKNTFLQMQAHTRLPKPLNVLIHLSMFFPSSSIRVQLYAHDVTFRLDIEHPI